MPISTEPTKITIKEFITGEGGQTELNNAGGDFTTFNPEQQGQIVMQYFVRRHLLGQLPADYAPWQPYIDVVQAGMPDRLVA